MGIFVLVQVNKIPLNPLVCTVPVYVNENTFSIACLRTVLSPWGFARITPYWKKLKSERHFHGTKSSYLLYFFGQHNRLKDFGILDSLIIDIIQLDLILRLLAKSDGSNCRGWNRHIQVVNAVSCCNLRRKWKLHLIWFKKAESNGPYKCAHESNTSNVTIIWKKILKYHHSTRELPDNVLVIKFNNEIMVLSNTPAFPKLTRGQWCS